MGSKFEHVFWRIGIEKGWRDGLKNLPFKKWLTMNKGVRYIDSTGRWKPIFGTCVWWLSEPKQK